MEHAVRREFLWPIDFDNVHYDWFLSDFTTVIINAVVCQGYHYRKGEYEYWTGGAPMDSATFFRWFMEPLMEGYSSENMLDAEWFGRLPQFLERHWFTFWVDNMRDPLFSLLSEDEQAGRVPMANAAPDRGRVQRWILDEVRYWQSVIGSFGSRPPSRLRSTVIGLVP